MNNRYLNRSLLTPVIVMLSALFMSSRVMAHIGHDHTANEAMLAHVLFYGSIAIAIGVCVWLAYRQYAKQKTK